MNFKSLKELIDLRSNCLICGEQFVINGSDQNMKNLKLSSSMEFDGFVPTKLIVNIKDGALKLTSLHSESDLHFTLFCKDRAHFHMARCSINIDFTKNMVISSKLSSECISFRHKNKKRSVSIYYRNPYDPDSEARSYLTIAKENEIVLNKEVKLTTKENLIKQMDRLFVFK